MKKQTRFKTFLLSSILFLFLIGFNLKSNTIQPNNLLCFLSDQDTIKDAQYQKSLIEQSKKIDKLDNKVDSVKIKWDAIEKAIRDKKEPH